MKFNRQAQSLGYGLNDSEVINRVKRMSNRATLARSGEKMRKMH